LFISDTATRRPSRVPYRGSLRFMRSLILIANSSMRRRFKLPESSGLDSVSAPNSAIASLRRVSHVSLKSANLILAARAFCSLAARGASQLIA
jgi:hypothetical protein